MILQLWQEPFGPLVPMLSLKILMKWFRANKNDLGLCSYMYKFNGTST